MGKKRIDVYLRLEDKVIKLEEDLSQSRLLLNELIKFYIDETFEPGYWDYSRDSISGLVKASKNYLDTSIETLSDLGDDIALVLD